MRCTDASTFGWIMECFDATLQCKGWRACGVCALESSGWMVSKYFYWPWDALIWSSAIEISRRILLKFTIVLLIMNLWSKLLDHMQWLKTLHVYSWLFLWYTSDSDCIVKIAIQASMLSGLFRSPLPGTYNIVAVFTYTVGTSLRRPLYRVTTMQYGDGCGPISHWGSFWGNHCYSMAWPIIPY